ncbi:MAG: hypothetical protein QOJ11_2108 [Frankiales bacterium]|jgi:hypothetical protein|nr:hypothetical protein [Frankiales bacterium]
MTTRMTLLLQGGVPEPAQLLDPDTVVAMARHRRTLQRAAAGASTALTVGAAVLAPSAMSGHHHRPQEPLASLKPSSAPRPSSTASRSAASETVTPSSAISDSPLVDEGPRIMWDARLSNSVVVSEDKLRRFPGLAFAPVVPNFGLAPLRIDVSTDPNSGGTGGLVELHYTFASSPAFPVDGRAIVTEQPVALAPGGLAGLATGSVPASAGTPIEVAGQPSLVHESQGSFSLVTVRGKALIIIAGPAVSRAEVLKLAAEL